MPIRSKNSLPKCSWPSQRRDAEEYRKCCEFLLSHLGERDDCQWPMARACLLEQYAIPAQLIDQIYKAGSIYASHSDIVFVHRIAGSGEIVGATLQSTKSNSSWRTIGDDRNAWFVVGNFEQAVRVVAVETPIEALSYSALFPDEAVVSCGDSLREVIHILNKDQRVVLAFCDTDKIIKAGRSVQKANGFWAFEGHRTQFNSWNEELHFRKKQRLSDW